MTDDRFQKTAQAIVDDLNGAHYYKDAKILTRFLSGELGTTQDRASEIAAAIHTDLAGSGYYRDVKILADYLRGQAPEQSAEA